MPDLTDAELAALGKDARWDSRYGERAIAELRALHNEALSWRGSIAMRDAELRALREQNAALVAEIEELKERLEHAHDYPNHNALARVRGAE